VTGDFISPHLSFGVNTVDNSDANGIFSDIFLARFEFNGTERWIKHAVGTYNENAYAIDAYGNDQLYLTGSFESLNVNFNGPTCLNSGATDLYYARMTKDSNSSALPPHSFESLQLSPNPFSTKVSLSWEPGDNPEYIYLMDAFGRQIFCWSEPISASGAILEMPSLVPGMYLLCIRATSGNRVIKLIRE